MSAKSLLLRSLLHNKRLPSSILRNGGPLSSYITYNPCTISIPQHQKASFWSWSSKDKKDGEEGKEKGKEEEKSDVEEKLEEAQKMLKDKSEAAQKMFSEKVEETQKVIKEKAEEVQSLIGGVGKKVKEEAKTKEEDEGMGFIGFVGVCVTTVGLAFLVYIINLEEDEEAHEARRVEADVQTFQDNLKRGIQPTPEEYCTLIWDYICVKRSIPETLELLSQWRQTTPLNIPSKEADRYVGSLDAGDRDLYKRVQREIKQDPNLALAVCVISKWEEIRAKEEKLAATDKTPAAVDIVAPTVKTLQQIADKRGLKIK
eukprot:Phypoly_transcript_11424.p1 GENE.Phypoly_transcript_11424~~Phypoly_transcript_11424.p1  ORF type:complete len:315 (+),score=60.66 Phypoly_transcript_11424:71-1015(+)